MTFLSIIALLAAAAPAPPPELAVERVVGGLDRPVSVKFRKGRAYIVEQHGRVRVLENGKLRAEPFVDLSRRVTRFFGTTEQGLFDIAFHPEFEANGRFFVHYTDRSGDTVLSELKAEKGKAFPGSEKVLLTEDQPYSNHNGGQLEFGPDGMLFLGLGDGGSAGDPRGNAQDLGSRLGKLLRFDVSRPGLARPAAGNPFLKRAGARPEIWAWGLRNPWRFSFDGRTLYIGDVGQNKWEEVDVEELGDGGGKNYGWNILEGPECFESSDCERSGLTAPVHWYRLYENGECSVIGGHVYRGKALPELAGHYFYADYCTGQVRSFVLEDGKAADLRSWSSLNPENRLLETVSSFGRDEEGEVYVVAYEPGALYRLVLRR